MRGGDTLDTFWIHHSTPFPGIAFWSGSNYFARTRWATSQILLDGQAGRTYLNYYEGLEMFVDVEPTLADPAILRTDPVWWENLRKTERYMYAVLEWRSDYESAWVEFYRVQFIINHDPVANAGPDHIVTLDAGGTVLEDIQLHASASSDPDSIYPDHEGPLKFSWALESQPATANPNSVVEVAASGLADIPDPLFLPLGTVVSVEEQGMYTFRVKVTDNEIATTGLRIGLPGEHSAFTRIYLAAAPPQLSIIGPTTSSPYISNWDDSQGGGLFNQEAAPNIDIPIYYSLGNVGNSPVYGGAWIVRLTIRQSMVYPYGSSPPMGAVVYRTEKVSPNPVDSFVWDGIITEGDVFGGNYVGWKAIGAFTIELELLDRDGNPAAKPGYPGDFYRITENNAIAIDYHRWWYPVRLKRDDIRMTGAFMESGHAGDFGTRLHAGIDIGSRRTPGTSENLPTHVVAAASGLFEKGTGHPMRVKHSRTLTTRYLHCANPLNLSNGTLVLQGAKLGDMSDVGTKRGNIHLHFEYQVLVGDELVIMNPLTILDLRDDHLFIRPPHPGEYPQIVGVYLRRAEPANQPARLAALPTGIVNQADIIVHCRDRAHPDHISGTGSYLAPFGMRINDSAGMFNRSFEFWYFIPGTNPHLDDFFTAEGQARPGNANSNYQLYMRGRPPVGREGGPVSIVVEVYDFVGHIARETIIVGADVRLVSGLPDPAITPEYDFFPVTIEVINRTENVADVIDNFHIELAGAPSGWTVRPSRTDELEIGVPTNVDLTIDSNGNKPAGIHDFYLVTYSDILDGVGTRVPISVRVQ
ncbi:MAG TPA: hypothetical protein DD706_21820 [Nitrospiraceae bacterium]|nr:hypothetical protein [Nitrospiraceae bacterium]